MIDAYYDLDPPFATAWVQGDYMDISPAWGLGGAHQGDVIEVLIDPETGMAMSVKSLERLAAEQPGYPEMLRDAELLALELSRPSPWLAGLGLGLLIAIAWLGWAAARAWSGRGSPTAPPLPPAPWRRSICPGHGRPRGRR